jgi:rhodanese-related sulfurtransferase
MPLADEVIVYPAHGAGSACGKNMMTETVDTLGNQKKVNYALRANMTRDEFINEVTAGLLPPPSYFPENVKMNKEGYESIDAVLNKGMNALSAEAFELTANESGALVLDTRDPQTFAKAFIPRSINIGIDGSFAPWVGALIPGTQQPLLIVAEKGREEEVITRLARVGFDNTLGYLLGGFQTWLDARKSTDQVETISASEFARQFKHQKLYVIDVRKPGEFQAEHIENAVNVPLDYINQHLAEIPKTGDIYLHCAGGYRSMIAASILKARGWNNLIDVQGGFKAMAETDVPRTDFTCKKANKQTS